MGKVSAEHLDVQDFDIPKPEKSLEHETPTPGPLTPEGSCEGRAAVITKLQQPVFSPKKRRFNLCFFLYYREKLCVCVYVF